MERQNFSSTHLRWEIMAIVTIRIDLAKNVFAVHGVDATGEFAGKFPFRRQQSGNAATVNRIPQADRWRFSQKCQAASYHGRMPATKNVSNLSWLCRVRHPEPRKSLILQEFLFGPALRIILRRNARLGQRVKQGRFTNIWQAHDATFHKSPLESRPQSRLRTQRGFCDKSQICIRWLAASRETHHLATSPSFVIILLWGIGHDCN